MGQNMKQNKLSVILDSFVFRVFSAQLGEPENRGADVRKLCQSCLCWPRPSSTPVQSAEESEKDVCSKLDLMQAKKSSSTPNKHTSTLEI